ncbi:MAG: hypothetical protein RLZZ262_1229, partial [Bacteroidota bacterium]
QLCAGFGVDDNGNPTTLAGKVGVSVGLGPSTPIQGSLGTGKATNAIPLIKF